MAKVAKSGKRGRPRTTETLNQKKVDKAATAVRKGVGYVNYAAEHNFNAVELRKALEARGFTFKRGRPAGSRPAPAAPVVEPVAEPVAQERELVPA